MTEVAIPDEFAEYVDREVASGKFRSDSEVVAEGLRLLQERERRRDALLSDLQVGIDQFDRGEYVEVKTQDDQDALFEDITGRRQTDS